MEIRPPEESDRQRIIDLMRIAFNVPSAWARSVGAELKLSRFLCGYERGRLAAMAQSYSLRQWFGGRALPMAGIAAVAAVPERRGAGLAPELVRALLRKARERGEIVSSLYPSRAEVYRRLGYEFSGVLTQYRLAVSEIPSLPSAPVGELGDDILPAVKECYSRFASTQNGLVESEDEDWWRLRVFRRSNPDLACRAVVTPGAGSVEGYAAFQLDGGTQPGWGYQMTCSHFIAAAPTAVAGLLSFFRGFRGLGQALLWYGPPNEPIGLIAGVGAESLSVSRSVRFMFRLIDVPAALEARGYPDVEGTSTFAVADDLFPDNQGPFRIEAGKGRMEVKRTESPSAVRLPIGLLSSLFAGYTSAADLARLGLLDLPPREADFFGRLFMGPPSWMTDFF